MGRNINFLDFGLCDIKCPICKHDLSEELSEIDLDCDVKSRSPNTFILNIQCFNCEHESDLKFKITLLED